MTRLLAAALFVVAAVAAHAQKIEVPDEIMQDKPIVVRVSGLAANATTTLQAEWASHSGTIWRSVTQITADEHGVAVPDVLALITSMTKTQERESDASRFDHEDHSTITLMLRDGDKTTQSHRVTLLKRKPGVTSTEIRDPFTGAFYFPYRATKLPVVIVLGGSEGGMPREIAALIASHGYASLAVAYFGLPGLPDELDRIPIENVKSAVDWLQSQPMIDAKRIAISGGSKGAELALVAASRIPAIKAVIANAPSSVVFEAISKSDASTSSWTFGGKELAFAHYVSNDAYKQSHKLIDLYIPSLNAAPPESEIEVEKINGPILLISGKQDMLWPSSEMANRIVARSEKLHGRFPITNLQFDDAGHHAGGMPQRPTIDSVRNGGTALGIARAQFKAWEAVFAFLSNVLGK